MGSQWKRRTRLGSARRRSDPETRSNRLGVVVAGKNHSGIETILVSEVLFYSGAAMLGCMGQNGKHGFWSGARAAFDICGDGNPMFCSKKPASGKDGPASEAAVTRLQNHAGKEKI